MRKRKRSDWTSESISHRRAAFCCNRPAYKHNPYFTPSILGRHTVVIPDKLNLFNRRGRESLYIFLRQLAEIPASCKVFIDFSNVSEVKVSAVLVLFAHLEIMLQGQESRRIFWKKPSDILIDSGLSELGIWALLGESYTPVDGAIRICSVSSEENQSNERKSLRDAIMYAKDSIAFHQDSNLTEDVDDVVFAAISESFTNVWQHAYAEDLGRKYRTLNDMPSVRKWWIALRHINGQLFMAVYDVGVGIPFSTRKKEWYTSLKQDVLEMIGGVSADNQDIVTALEYGNSRYNVQGRGNGLPAMKKFVEINPDGVLRIMSGKGMYIYRSQTNKESSDDLEFSFPGTLVQWNVALTAGGKSDEN